MSALALTAVGSTRRQTRVALAADLLVAVVLAGEHLERRLNDTTTKTEDQVEGRLLLDVVVGKRAAVLELLAGKDQALLVGGNALLVLDLGLDIVDGVRGLDLEGDGLTCEDVECNVAKMSVCWAALGNKGHVAVARIDVSHRIALIARNRREGARTIL